MVDKRKTDALITFLILNFLLIDTVSDILFSLVMLKSDHLIRNDLIDYMSERAWGIFFALILVPIKRILRQPIYLYLRFVLLYFVIFCGMLVYLIEFSEEKVVFILKLIQFFAFIFMFVIYLRIVKQCINLLIYK